MKKTFILVLTLCFTGVYAQNYKYGKVSKEELESTQSSIDPEAAGEILYEKATYKLEYVDREGRFYLTREVEGRIKVYDKDRIDDDFLRVELRYYEPSSAHREKVQGLKGATYNLVGGKVESEKIRGRDIFTERQSKYWVTDKFAFPNVQNGSVLEYSYSVLSPHYREIDRWYFQSELPVVYSEYSFTRPSFFVYSRDERGEIQGRAEDQSRPNNEYNFDEITTTYIFRNLPPLKKEAYVFNPNNLKSSLRYELMKVEHPTMISENYATTWEQIGKDLMESSSFGRQLKGNAFLDETVQTVSSLYESPEEKMAAIFDYVKEQYTWDGFRSFRTDNGLRQTLKTKTGNAADINLLLVSMLQKAGITTYPVVLSTVGNLIINYAFPSLTSLDFVIAASVINDRLFLMDATEKYSSINMLPLRDLNHRGFLVMENGIQEIELTNYSLSSARETISAELNADGTLSGSYSEMKDQYFAMTEKMSKNANPEKFTSSYLKDLQFDPEDFKIDENDEKGLIRYSFKFSDIPGGEVFGDKIVVNPLLFTRQKENDFTRDGRSYPLEFGTMMSESRTVKIKIPEGYKVQSLPKNGQFTVRDNVAGYKYEVEEKDGYILVTTLNQIGHSILSADYYKPMKDFEDKKVNTESQEVILEKL